MDDSNFINQINKRRTFAIISHPDAGKTTITEKLLLYGNRIQTAGTVKGRGSDRHATSDWMEMEKQRGISVTTSVMQFPYKSAVVNLLDTAVRHLAKLAKLRLEPDEMSAYRADLEALLGFVDQINTQETEAVEPLSHPMEIKQRMRSDKVTEFDQREQFQQLSPSATEGFYVVPKVID